MAETGTRKTLRSPESAGVDSKGILNWVLALEEAPGSLFVYNNMATYMCSAIVTKVTGLSTHDYLMPRLFTPLGMGDPFWTTCPKGISSGAFGLRLTTEQISRFGQTRNGSMEQVRGIRSKVGE